MKNMNTKEELEDIKRKVMEHLAQLPPVPSVQMAYRCAPVVAACGGQGWRGGAHSWAMAACAQRGAARLGRGSGWGQSQPPLTVSWCWPLERECLCASQPMLRCVHAPRTRPLQSRAHLCLRLCVSPTPPLQAAREEGGGAA
jgi:hypothetical protein